MIIKKNYQDRSSSQPLCRSQVEDQNQLTTKFQFKLKTNILTYRCRRTDNSFCHADEHVFSNYCFVDRKET